MQERIDLLRRYDVVFRDVVRNQLPQGLSKEEQAAQLTKLRNEFLALQTQLKVTFFKTNISLLFPSVLFFFFSMKNDKDW